MEIRPMNIESGELLQGRLCWIPAKRENGFKEGWIAMSQTALKTIIQMNASGVIDDRDFRVLFALTATLDFENLIQVCQVDLAREVGMHKQHVNRSLKKLCGRHLIISGPKVGRHRTYRLNPNVGWKGSAKNHRKHLKLVSDTTEGLNS